MNIHEQSIVHIDRPKSGAVVPQLFKVCGWYASSTVVDKVELRIGERSFLFQFHLREDVEKKLNPKYKYVRGFSIDIDVESFKDEMTDYLDVILFDERGDAVKSKRTFFRAITLSENSNNNNVIIILHIPKTAGTTLRSMVESIYRESVVCKIYEENKPWCISYRQFEKYSASKISQFDVFIGHINLGIHSFMRRPSRYVTVMRRPVDRVVSLYNHISRDSNHIYHNAIKNNNWSAVDFAVSGLWAELDNHQVRMLSGMNPPVGEIDDSILKIAKDNLIEYFDVVGLTERFEETVAILRSVYSWPEIPYRNRNIAPGKRAILSKEEYALIENANSFDVLLYDFAERLFEEKLHVLGLK